MQVKFSAEPLHDAAVDLLVVGAGESFAEDLAGLDAKFGSRLIAHLKQQKFTGKGTSSVLVPSLGRVPARDLLVVAVGDRSRDNLLRAAAKAGRQARDLGAATLALALGGDVDVASISEAVALGNYVYDPYKPASERTAAVAEITVRSGATPGDQHAADVRSVWQSWVRNLVSAPAAEATPARMAVMAESALSTKPHVTVEVLDENRLRAEKYVGMIAVGQGSSNPPRVVHVRYAPPGAKAHIALVGKGVTFDSGGLSLKPSGSMQTMRCDMAGAATVLGATAAIAELGIPVTIDAYVGLVENMVSGSSYKLGDILEYRNGVTVEIHNTDAEGRLVLADCLIDACKTAATEVVDLATLTGAVVVALGPDFTGAYVNDDALWSDLNGAANQNGELLWRMPLHDGYKAWLKGDWGQLKNISGKPDAGSITAALFLTHFVAEKKWAHLDIAGSAFFEKASGPYAAGGTGQTMRTLIDWVAAKAK